MIIVKNAKTNAILIFNKILYILIKNILVIQKETIN